MLKFFRTLRGRTKARQARPGLWLGLAALYFVALRFYVSSGVELPLGWHSLAAICGGAAKDSLSCFIIFAAMQGNWNKGQRLCFCFALFFLFALAAADALIFARFERHIDRSLLYTGSFAHLTRHFDLPFVACAAGIAAISAGLAVKLASQSRFPSWRALPLPVKRAGLLLACLALINVGFPQRLGHYGIGIGRKLSYRRNLLLREIEKPVLVTFYKDVLSARTTQKNNLSNKLVVLDKYERAALASMGLADAERQLLAEVTPNIQPFSRVVLILLDSFPRDFLRKHNARIPPGTAPFLDDLAETNPSFERIWSVQPAREQGIYSMMFSRPDFDPINALRYRLPSLFSEMQKAGFRGFFLNGYPRHALGPVITYASLGAQRLVMGEDLFAKYGVPDPALDRYSDDVVFREAIDILELNRDHPLLLVISTGDTRPPYYSGTMPHSPLRMHTSAILSSVHWTDHLLRNFFDQMAKRDLIDHETLVVLTSTNSPNHGDYLEWVDATTLEPEKVPLILVANRPLEIEDLTAHASQMDLAPTILNLCGLTIPANFWGKSLLRKGGYGLSLYDDSYIFHFPNFSARVGNDIEKLALNKWLPLRNRALRKWLFNASSAANLQRAG
jgi:phosphoglycerol transferase MdoB-like AlkP superfamily enzyme